jgi:hypothetical protein
MKSAKLFLSLTVFFSSVLLAGDKEDIIKQIMASNDYVNKNKTNMSEYSKEGALEFWSSGGLLHEVGPDGRSDEYENFNMSIKHVEVLILVPKKAAVAMYYSEGSMTPKESKPVGHYMTRVTQAFVKENGEWRIRASHWSPIMGGAGTSQTATN